MRDRAMKRQSIIAIFALLFAISLFGDAELRVIDADARGFSAVFSVGDIHLAALEGGYSAIEIPNAGVVSRLGNPELPAVSEYVLLAPNAMPSLECEILDADTMPAAPPAPAQYPAHESGEAGGPVVGESAIYQGSSVWPANFASIAALGRVRGTPIGMLTLCPVRYDFAEGAYIIVRRARVSVNLGGELTAPPERLRSRAFAEMLRKIAVNGNVIPYPLPDDPGVYLVICPDTCWSALDDFAEHKEARGHTVIRQRLSEIASPITKSAIMSYLQAQFDTLNPAPTFVILVGDNEMDDGTEVPNYGYSTFHSDHTYSLLDGDDFFSDVFLARMPIDNIREFRVLIEKIKRYENSPLLAGSDWMRRGAVVSTYDHAVTPVWNVMWVRQVLLNHGFTQVDTFFENGSTIPPASDITNAVDRGLSYIDYRGWAGSDGWWEPAYDCSNVLFDLANSNAYPVVTSIVCGTGDFGSAWTDPCFGEAWLRAGSEANPRGAVAFFGTTDHDSHTRYNNPINSGFYKGLFDFDLPHTGQDVWLGESECLRLHPTELSEVEQYFMTYELLGDPGLMMYHGAAPELSVSHSPIEIGARVDVDVASGGEPLEGALVCLYREGSDERSIAYTDHLGKAHPTVLGGGSGNIRLTVVSPFCVTYSEDFAVSGVPNVEIVAVSFDDASGDGDGRIDPNESGQLSVTLHNYGHVLKHVEAYLSCDHEGITIDAPFDSLWRFWNGTERTITFEVSSDGAASGGGPAEMILLCDSRDGAAVLPFSMPLQASVLTLDSLIIDDSAGGDGDGTIEPGESAECRLAIGNSGSGDPSPLIFRVYSSSGWLDVDGGDSVVVTSLGHPGSGLSSSFELSASAAAFEGTPIDLRVYRVVGGREVLFDEIRLTLGVAETSDPTGPDRWGYFAYDNSDAASGYAPTSTFEDISSTGTHVAIGDDEVVQIPLSFDFVFYGETFETLTVCSNGWAAPGVQPPFMLTFYNNPIPAPNGPWGTIAPFWDDLEPIVGAGGLYYQYFPAEKKLVVQWERMQQARIAGMDNTFQIAIFDPTSHPTCTGDSPIEFRYSGGIENVDTDEEYSTVGIESPDHLLGLEYMYSLRSDAGAAPLMDGRVIRFTTDCGAALIHGRVALEGGDPEGVVVDLSGGHRTEADVLGDYRFVNVVPGDHLLRCSAPGHFAVTETVTTSADESITIDFDLALAPIPGPLFASKADGSPNIALHWSPPASALPDNYMIYKYLSPSATPTIIETTDTAYVDDDVFEGRKYWYRVAAEYENGSSFPSNPDSGWLELFTGMDEAAKPKMFDIRIAPNPFNTTLNIEINTPDEARITIYDILGKAIGSADFAAGESRFDWDGLDADGNCLPSGIYLIEARTKDKSIAKKAVMLK